MKRFFITLLAFVAIGQLVTAQEDISKKSYVSTERAYHADEENVVHERGWVRSHLLDDWFLELQGGGQLYYGTDDRLGAFGDRLTGNIEMHIGRRIFPMFGFRLTGGIGYAHGFLSVDNYNLGNHAEAGDGQCGTDALGNPLGGYYYPYSDDLYIQKWSYLYYGADLFLDLALFRTHNFYKANRMISNILYIGAINRNGISETDSRNHRTEAHLGYIFRYNLSEHWGIFADVRGSFMERLFDREWVKGAESSGFGLDFILNAQVGVRYRFHARDDEQRSTFYRKDALEYNSNTMAFITYIQMEDTVILRNIDTLLVQKSINTPTPETQRMIDSLQDAINDKLNRGKQRAMDMPLDSILINRLLPYEMVYFDLDKWDIRPSEEMKIDKMARIMKAYPNERFLLNASADAKTGTVERNDYLSHRRADIVYDRLINEYGIDPSRLERKYLGGILDYTPYQLNRTTVIIMDHPAVQKAFEQMKREGRAGKN